MQSNTRTIIPAPRIRRKDSISSYRSEEPEKMESESSTTTSPEVSDASPSHAEVIEKPGSHIIIETHKETRSPIPTRVTRGNELIVDFELIFHSS